MILIGDIISVENDTAIVNFRSINKNGIIDIKDIKHLEKFMIPGIRITYDTENKKVEIPIVKWQENNKTKLLGLHSSSISI